MTQSTPALPTERLAALLRARDWAAAGALLARFAPEQYPAAYAEAAALALQVGQPALALSWATDPLVRAAALLRLGQSGAALTTLQHAPDTARTAVLRARALWQQEIGQQQSRSGQERGAREAAILARQQARREGDAGATIAAATLHGEQLLAEPYAALRALAEGLKVAELLGTEADPFLLAVLAHAQSRTGGKHKAQATAQKALSRAEGGSPGRVVALHLHDPAAAHAEAQTGQLAAVWLVPYSAHDAT